MTAMEQIARSTALAWPSVENPWLDAFVARDADSECSLRRIWDISPAALAIVMGVLLRRADVEELFDGAGDRDQSGIREDVLRVTAVARCTRPCAFAEAVEGALDTRTERLRHMIDRCPMMELASWWSQERDVVPGEDLAALLWQLSRDPRPYLEQLTTRVQGDLFVQAFRLVRERRCSTSRGRGAVARIKSHSPVVSGKELAYG